MYFSGTFLNSIVAKRIAWMLFLAAFIPTALITGLASRTIDKMMANYHKKNLVDISQNYGLDAFSNLTFARSNLDQIAKILALPLDQQNAIETLQPTIFQSLVIFSDNGASTTLYGTTNYQVDTLAPSLHNQQKSAVFVLPANQSQYSPPIIMSVPFKKTDADNIHHQQYLIGEIRPNYLWGEKSDYPSDINFCAYSHIKSQLNQAKQMIFCSGDNITPTQLEEISTQKDQLFGQWELFLRAEFQHDAWGVVTLRNYAKTIPAESFITNVNFISISILSLLIVALMGIMHIRKTMVPLEKLISGTRSIAKGEFKEVIVEGQSEFAELAHSFNGMSSHIQRQLDTLQNLATLDKDMATKLNVDHVVQHIIRRIESLIPHATVAVFRLHDITEHEAQCSIDISKHAKLNHQRVAIASAEIGHISQFPYGHFSECNTDSTFQFEKKLAYNDAKFSWVLPVFWQGTLCAFIAIGKASAFQTEDPHWEEIRELAGRIGIAISAQAREDQLLTQAQYDSLTGLPNRILLQDRLRQAMEHSDHTEQAFWLAFIDLDRFKFINDSLGHKAGDQLLIEVSKRLSHVVRDTDTVARFGGDEFIIIMQGETDEHLRMDMLSQLISASETPILIEGNEIFVSASIGIAVYPTDAPHADGLLRNADVAMYRAKEMGKNNFQFFTQTMNKRVTDRLLIETHLRKALELNELKVVYQPKVDLISKKIVGMEALLRWHSQALGFISPQQFIPLAEETGLIIPIGEWVLRTACAQTVAWQQAGFEDLLISVNLSARQFKQKDLVNSIEVILKETGLQASNLELELTESLVMNGVEESMKILHGIKSIGVHLSVDDFGTGYSSLAYLKSLPLDTLKIDKSFTDDIVNHTDNVPIVASVILLAKNLGLKVVAEGVETYEQVRYLTAHHCNEMQGYYFSRPENAETFEAMLTSHKMLSAPEITTEINT